MQPSRQPSTIQPPCESVPLADLFPAPVSGFLFRFGFSFLDPLFQIRAGMDAAMVSAFVHNAVREYSAFTSNVRPNRSLNCRMVSGSESDGVSHMAGRLQVSRFELFLERVLRLATLQKHERNAGRAEAEDKSDGCQSVFGECHLASFCSRLALASPPACAILIRFARDSLRERARPPSLAISDGVLTFTPRHSQQASKQASRSCKLSF